MNWKHSIHGQFFYNKYALCEHIGWDNLTTDNLHDSSIIIADNFNDYKFSRRKSDFKSLAIKRIISLRETHEFLRLWYSTGADSSVVLSLAEEAGVEFDEIVSFKYDKLFDCPEQTEENFKRGIPNKYLTSNRFKLLDIPPEYLEQVFKGKWWADYQKTYNNLQQCTDTEVMYNSGFYPKLLHYSDNTCDVVGSVTPTIFFENDKWVFRYNEHQMNSSTYKHAADFIVSRDMPELQESYINAIADELEIIGQRLNWHETLTHLDSFNGNQRTLRDKIPLFKNLDLPAQLPKTEDSYTISNSQYKDMPWYIGINTVKEHLHLQRCLVTKPKYFEYYCNSDWDTIAKMKYWGTVLSRDFVLE